MQDKVEQLLKNAGFSDNRPSNSLASAALNGGGSANSEVTDAIQKATDQIQALKDATQTSADSITANTDALSQNSPSTLSSVGSEVSGSLSQAADSLLSGGGLFGGSGGGLSGLLGGGGLLSSLFSGISSLFGGGSSQPPPLTRYDAPPKQSFSLADSNGTLSDAVDDSYGQPRATDFTELAMKGLQPASQSGAGASGSANTPGSSSAQQATHVTVQVQAMDSRSFMDHSGDIAQAVREAMLNMHSINDVVNDL